MPIKGQGYNDHNNPNIALWGARTIDNFGDRLIAEITEHELAKRIPQAEFQHYCPWSKGIGALPLSIDRDGKWPGNGMYDAIVVVGGGLLGGPPFKHPIMQVFCFGPDPSNFELETFLAWNAVGLQDGSMKPTKPGWHTYLDSVCSRLNYCTCYVPMTRQIALRLA